VQAAADAAEWTVQAAKDVEWDEVGSAVVDCCKGCADAVKGSFESAQSEAGEASAVFFHARPRVWRHIPTGQAVKSVCVCL
jgi:hypothetical protein